MFNFRDKSISFQLRTVITACFSLAFIAVGSIVYRFSYDVLLHNTLDEHSQRVQSLSKALAGQYEVLADSLSRLEDAFVNGYISGLQHSDKLVQYQGYQVEDLLLNGISLIDNIDIVDRFTESTGAVATVFAKTGNDFVRISTSLRDQQNQRVLGTTLGTNHPGYKQLIDGQSYEAKVVLFGTPYLTHYAPLYSADGSLVGLSFVGILIDSITEKIFNQLGQIKWGENGYTMVLSNSPANQGQFFMHPTKTDGSILDVADNSGNRPFKQLFDSSSGVLQYDWTEKNGKTGKKYLVYSSVEGWQWKIVGGTFIHEVTAASRHLLSIIVIVCVLISLLTLVGLSWFLNRTNKPLIQVSKHMSRLGKGEISLDVEKHHTNSQNEAKILTNSISDTANQLRRLVSDIRETADSVYGLAGGVSSDAQLSLSQVEKQQQTVEQMVSAVEEMAQSSTEVARQIDIIAVNANDADTSSQSGMQVVGQVTKSINELNQMLESSSQSILSVSRDSEKIQEVTSIINDIAEQTNLLALNAAIEAARAGEMGRGFAVVADEVRTLAHRTQTSVSSVSETIEQLKQSTQQAVSLMQRSQSNANQVVVQAQQAGQALESIAKQVGDVNSQAETIASTAEQQSKVSQQIASDITQICSQSTQTKEITAKTAQSSEVLQSRSVELQKKVEYFH